ncbi:MAG: AAA domain-containing protein [Sphingosinicella sp.]
MTKLPGHRWALAGGAQGPKPEETAKPNRYAALFRYYLDCLASDAGVGVSVFAESRYDLDYALLPSMPLDASPEIEWAAAEGVDRLLGRQRREAKTKTLWLGWPLAWRQARSRTGWTGAFVEPVLLWPLDVDAEMPTFFNEPVLNMKLLERFAGDTNPLEEAAELSEILGIDTAEDLDPADLGAQLASVRPDWPWAESPDPDALSTTSPEFDDRQIAIFNRAAIVLADREPFTVGLETELRNLQAVLDKAIEQSALGVMIAGAPSAAEPFAQPILEAAPLNAEQRDAIRSALSSPLTVITGPPGTGKSQVVTAIIVNAAYHGLKVLFASKNNKAVDVVEERVNGLATRPVLMRLGGRTPREGTADQLASILSVRSNATERAVAEKARQEVARIGTALADLDSRIERLRIARNLTDAAEQRAEAARQLLGEEKFADLTAFDIAGAEQVVQALVEAAGRADRSRQGLFVRLLWSIFQKDRLARFASAAFGANALAERLGVMPCPDDPGISSHWCEALQPRLDAAAAASEYHALRAELLALGDPADLTRERVDRLADLSNASHAAWEGWLASMGERLSSAERKALGDYIALLRTIANTQEGGGQISREIWSRYYRLAAQVANVMPGWAVTSLSAKGRVPFESALFDLVVVDEASQCDIASVLPLLFRAKRAVIIGDPQQLRHISRLTADKDQAFMVRHGVLDDPGAGWSYRAVSLYELGQSRVPADSVVTLRDHHRSHEAIIRFSNQQFYGGGLRVATDYSLLHRHGQPALRWIDVKGKVVRPTDGGAVNDKEATAVVDELRRLAIEQRYPGSIGVVTPFRAQARRIRDLVSRDGVLATILAAREFLSDTAHKFQGDERDLMIFSPVVSGGVSEGALGFLRRSGHLFNVAITRGRASVVTVGDKAACAQSDVTYLKQFVTYCDSWESALEIEQRGQTREPTASPIYPTVGRPELVSDWEHVFYEMLVRAGIPSVPQYDFDQYILDFAIISQDGRRLDVEIDGERYHRDWNGEHVRRDQLRDMRLMEMGWDVRRFWVYEVRDEPGRCIDVIETWMN